MSPATLTRKPHTSESNFAATGGAWSAAAARLAAAVPRLSDWQVITGLAGMIALLHDDETLLEFPDGPVLPFDAQQFGSGLYLLAVPPGTGPSSAPGCWHWTGIPSSRS